MKRIVARASAFLLVATLLAHASPSLAQTPPLPILSWGGFGNGPGQFYDARGIAVDASGRVLVVDAGSHRVQVFTRTGAFVQQWGVYGTGPGQFNQPTGIAVDPAGYVYVVDTGNNRVQKFDGAGGYVGEWGSAGPGPGQFLGAIAVAADAAGNIFVVDTYGNRVERFTNAGVYLGEWGTPGGGDGQFSNPSGVATDADGNVYVTDTYSHRVQKFDGTGTFLTKWGSYGTGDGEFDQPTGIAVDTAGVWVVDAYLARVQRFTRDGQFILKWGSQGGQFGHLQYPSSIALDDSSNAYVTDGTARVQKFGHRQTRRWRVPADFTSINAATFAAGFGDTVVVAPGTYYEQLNTNGKALVLAGRFLDTGDGNDIPRVVVDGQGFGPVLTCNSGEDAGTRIVGLTLRNGSGYFGGGVSLQNASPSLEHLSIHDNVAQTGGGIYVGYSSSPRILSCTIARNRAATGAGIYTQNYLPAIGSPTDRCSIYDNRVTARPDFGADLYGFYASTTVYLDYFTTDRPNEAQIYPLPGPTMDILRSAYSPIAAPDIHVAPSGSDTNDGLSPATSLRSLRVAMIRAAPPSGGSVRIHLAAGTYDPVLTGEGTCHVRSFVSVSGADSGTTIVDGLGQMTLVYALDVVGSEFSDLTLRNGAVGDGAIHVENSSLGFRRCVVRDNTQQSSYPYNAGIACLSQSDVTIRNCTIANNVGSGILTNGARASIRDNLIASNMGPGVWCTSGSDSIVGNTIVGAVTGGGIDCSSSVDAFIYGNTIEGNRAERGGGISCRDASPVIRDNVIRGNVAYGGYSESGGGGIWCAYSTAVIDSNRIEANQASGQGPDGGGLACHYGGPVITRNTFVSNVARDTTGYPLALGRGGAIFIDSSSPTIGGSPDMANTFSGNVAIVGADLCAIPFPPAAVGIAAPPPVIIDARFNHFRVYPVSGYLVARPASFDLSGGSGDFAPIGSDVFVSPTGNDANDGVHSATPFRTIQSALGRVLATPGHPVSIHIGPGTYSPSRTGETFPLPMVSDVSLRGSGAGSAILDAEGKGSVIVCDGVDRVTVTQLRIQNGKAGAGGGVFCRATTCSLTNNVIRGNSAFWGAGVFCTRGGNPVLANNQILLNRAPPSFGYARFGAGVAANDGGGPTLINNLIALNISDEGAGVAVWNQSSGRLVNNTIAFNLASNQGEALSIVSSDVGVRNCIFHDNSSPSSRPIAGQPTFVEYSNVEGGWPGTGNVDVDPRFDTNQLGHLEPDSPCIDAGDPAIDYNDVENPMQPGAALPPAFGALRNDMGAFGGPGSAGQPSDYPTPALLSLVSARASLQAVTLTWFGTIVTGADAIVHRRAIDGEWVVLGPAAGDASGLISYVDTRVTPGAAFLYRLEYTANGVRAYSDEVLVRVPVSPQFGIQGLRPNPAVADLTIDFMVPTREAASMELLDVQGRRVWTRELAAPEPGSHTLRMTDAHSFAPGLYFVRLKQAGRVATAKAIVSR